MEYQYLEFYHSMWVGPLADIFRIELGEDGVTAIFLPSGEDQFVVEFEDGTLAKVNHECVQELDYVRS